MGLPDDETSEENYWPLKPSLYISRVMTFEAFSYLFRSLDVTEIHLAEYKCSFIPRLILIAP